MTIHPDLARLAAMIARAPAQFVEAQDRATIADWLYRCWYLVPEEGFVHPGRAPPIDPIDAALSAIVDARSPWTNGWVVLATAADGRCLAGKGAVRRWAEPGRYAGEDRPGLPPMPGDRISMPDHAAWCDAETGQWAAACPAPPEGTLVRLYFNAGADRIGYAVDRLMVLLVREGLAYRMKCPARLDGFARADSLVVYLSRDAWSRREADICGWAEQMEPVLRPGRPALTRSLAIGVAMADDPGDGRSFGQHRCDVIAAALCDRAASGEDLLPHFGAALTRAGISAAEPWRSVG